MPAAPAMVEDTRFIGAEVIWGYKLGSGLKWYSSVMTAFHNDKVANPICRIYSKVTKLSFEDGEIAIFLNKKASATNNADRDTASEVLAAD